MKNYFMKLLLCTLGVLLVTPLCITAQTTVKKSPTAPKQDLTQQPASLKVQKPLASQLPDQIAAAQAQYEARLKAKDYYANDEIKQSCEGFKECADWAQKSFRENSTFQIFLVNSHHETIYRDEDGQPLKLKRVEVLFFYKQSGKDLVKAFRFRNLAATDKRCVGCADYIRINYMQGGGVYR